MKKILAILIVFLVFSSCKKTLEDLNKNTKDPSAVSGESLFTGAQKAFFDQMTTSNVNSNIWRLTDQYWNETTYNDEANYNLVSRQIPDNFWNTIYTSVLKNLDESKKIITATAYPYDPSPTIKQNKLAIVDILSVHAWSTLVETFGNIPYSQALNINNILPKYDDGKQVYENLITRLNTDITALENNLTAYPACYGFGSVDNVYGNNAEGDVTCWIKYANSLRLRMGMLLCDADPAFSVTTVNAAIADKLISDNSENCVLAYSNSAPNTNPMYEDQVASGRHDFIAAVTIIDTMNNWNDPRLPLFFTQVDTGASATPAYIGAQIGINGFYTYFSNAASTMWQPTFPGTMFEYSEVEFLLAEAAARGGGYNVSGSAESHYNNGIKASIEWWGQTTGMSTTDADAAYNTYITQPNIAYNTALGTFKQKIGMQQWIAYYNRGFDAWTELRKMQYPVLNPGANALSAFPVRFTYPIEEQTLNGTNYAAAAAAINGDAVTTTLFFWTALPPYPTKKKLK